MESETSADRRGSERHNARLTIPAVSPYDYVQLFKDERARLLRMLEALSTEDWRRATPCPGWDVLGLVNHLVGDDLSLISWQRHNHRGTPAPAGSDAAAFTTWLDGAGGSNHLARIFPHPGQSVAPLVSAGFE